MKCKKIAFLARSGCQDLPKKSIFGKKTVILADAYKISQEIRGEGEAKALDIYASSFSKDPKFYEFVRTLEAYEKIIDKKTTLVFPGDSKLFKELTQ